MKNDKVFILVISLGVLILLFAMYQQYAENKLEQERMLLASQGLQQYNQAILDAGIAAGGADEHGFIGGILSGLPIVGGWF